MTHPFAYTPNKSGAYDMKAGDRVIYLVDGRRGVADEFLQDGDTYVTWDDGTFGNVKWQLLISERGDISLKPNFTKGEEREGVMDSYENEEFEKLMTVIKAANQNGPADGIRLETEGFSPKASVSIKAYVLEKFIRKPDERES